MVTTNAAVSNLYLDDWNGRNEKMAKVTTSVAVSTRIWMTELNYAKGHYLCCGQHWYLDDEIDVTIRVTTNAAVSNLYLDD